MMVEKTLGFLIDCPTKGKAMLFPGFIEDYPVSEKYEQVDLNIFDYLPGWDAKLANSKYIVFKKKETKKIDYKNDKDRVQSGVEEQNVIGDN